MRRRVTAILMATLLAFTGWGLTAAPAEARVYDRLINKSSLFITGSQVLVACYAGYSGATCTISQTRTASRTIQTDLGVSRTWLAAQLGISSSSGVQTTVQCSQSNMKVGQRLAAHPKGTRYKYQIQRYSAGVWTTSPYRYSFNPRANHVACLLTT